MQTTLLRERICFKNYSVTNATGNTKTGISEVQLDVSVSGTNASFIIQAIDISQDPGNSLQLLQMLMFLLESTSTSTEVEQVYRSNRIWLYHDHN